MDEKQLITAFIISLVAIGIIWFIFSPQPEKQDIPETGTVQGAGWEIYSNRSLGFEVGLPPGFEPDQSYARLKDGPGGEISAVAFRLPESFTRDSNIYSDSRISVEKLSDVSCTPSDFLAGDYFTDKATIGDREFSYATTSQSSGGDAREESVYVTSRGRDCFAIRYFIHSRNVGEYVPGSIRVYNRDNLVKTFDGIASTFMTY